MPWSASALALRPGRPASGPMDRPRGGRGGRYHRSRRPWARAVALAEERFGGLDAMVAVAGVIAGGVPLWEMPADQLGAVLGVDLGGPDHRRPGRHPGPASSAYVPRQGRFLAVASAAATRGLPRLAAYGAAKAGVAGLVRGLAADLAGTGITANAVSPGSTATAMLDESARLYGLDDTRTFADQQVGAPAARPRGGGGGSGVAGRCGEQCADRGGDPRGRRPLAVTALPAGFGLVLDRSVRSLRDGAVLVGGHPGRLITLSLEGVAAPCPAPRWPGPPPTPPVSWDAAWSRPAWPTRARSDRPGRDDAGWVTVVVPVHNRIDDSNAASTRLGPELPMVVVDDDSDDPGAVARMCGRPNVRLVRRDVNGGPGAARNEALGLLDSELVAFVDSDCQVTEGWLEELLWWFDDPAGGRGRPPDPPRPSDGAGSTVRASFADAHSALDMGPEASQVGPGRGGPLPARRGPGRSAGGRDLRLRCRPPGRRGRRPGLAPARSGLAGPVRPVGHGPAPRAGLVAAIDWAVGSATEPRRERCRGGTPARSPRSSSVPGPRSPRWLCCPGAGAPRP